MPVHLPPRGILGLAGNAAGARIGPPVVRDAFAAVTCDALPAKQRNQPGPAGEGMTTIIGVAPRATVAGSSVGRTRH